MESEFVVNKNHKIGLPRKAMKRLHLLIALLLALGVATPAAHADLAALANFKGSYTVYIPFLARGASQTVGDIKVTATSNTALAGPSANMYLHQSMAKVATTLTFEPGIPGFQAETSFHTDAPGGGFEDYEFTGYNSANQVVFTKHLKNVNGSFPYNPGAAAGEVNDLITKMDIKYTFDSGAAENSRGSYLKLALTDKYLSASPTSRQNVPTVNGTSGTAITSSPALNATGLAGTITYEISSGTLPAGLTLDPATGVISGTPTAASNGTITIRGKGSTYGSATINVTFNIAAPAAPAPTPTPTPTPTPSVTPTPTPTPSASATPADNQSKVTAAAKPTKLSFDVFFDVVSVSLTSEAKESIKAAVKKVKSAAGADSKITVRVTGWVQPAGPKSNVQYLSRGRAAAVVAELKKLGLSAKYVLVTPGEDDVNNAKSRRASTVITVA